MRSLRDLGLAGGLSAGIYAGMVLAPSGAAALIWFVPLPGLLLAATQPHQAMAWLVLTSLALAVGMNAACSVGFVMTLGLSTVIIAHGVARSWTLERTVTVALAVWTIGVGSLYVIDAGGFSAAASAAGTQVDNAFALTVEASRAAGADENALTLLQSERESLVQSVLRILPGMVSLTGGTILSANVAMVRRIVPMFGEFQLRRWGAPESLIWAFIAAGFGMFAPIDWVAVLAANVFVVLLGCYFLQGLGIVAYYLDRFALPMSLRVGAYMLIAIQQLLAAVVLALGIFDLWGDFRRLQTGAADASLGSDGD